MFFDSLMILYSLLELFVFI